MEADHVVFPSVGCLTESWNGSKAGEHQPGPTSTASPGQQDLRDAWSHPELQAWGNTVTTFV